MIKKVKNAVPFNIETFYEKELQKTNQREFRIEQEYIDWTGEL